MDGGHRAIVFNRLSGVKEGVMAEGMHFIIPWFEWPYIYDVRTKPRNVQVNRRGGGVAEEGGGCTHVSTCRSRWTIEGRGGGALAVIVQQENIQSK